MSLTVFGASPLSGRVIQLSHPPALDTSSFFTQLKPRNTPVCFAIRRLISVRLTAFISHSSIPIINPPSRGLSLAVDLRGPSHIPLISPPRAVGMASSRASNSASEASSPEDIDMADPQAGATRVVAVKNGYFKDVSFFPSAFDGGAFCAFLLPMWEISDGFVMQEPLDTPDYTVCFARSPGGIICSLVTGFRHEPQHHGQQRGGRCSARGRSDAPLRGEPASQERVWQKAEQTGRVQGMAFTSNRDQSNPGRRVIPFGGSATSWALPTCFATSSKPTPTPAFATSLTRSIARTRRTKSRPRKATPGRVVRLESAAGGRNRKKMPS